MNPTELTSHLREHLRAGTIAEHLREVHGVTDIPTKRQDQATLHQRQHIGDMEESKPADVLAGVTAKPEDVAAARPKPRPRTRKVETVKPAARSKASKPETPVQTAKRTARKPAPAPAARKPRAAAKPAPAPEANGALSPREQNQDLARRLIDSIAKEFADASKADQQKIANWLHPLPTGGAGWERYWPTSFPRPTSSGWRKPAATR